MDYRTYDPDKDKEATNRIMREVGWLEKGKEEALNTFIEDGDVLVADVHGEPECLVVTAPAVIRYLNEALPFSAVTAVATSRVARKQGLAKQLTAQAVARDAAEGALVSGLGMFDQGYYNQLGYGTGGYEHDVAFDPAHLNVDVKARVPRRITTDDWGMVHACRLARFHSHGTLDLVSPALSKADMLWADNGFGLGYCDGPAGEMTHHFWCSVKEDMENGPYNVWWVVYQTPDQFLELMGLIKNLADQVRLVRMREPRGLQFQDLLERPFYRQQISEKSKFESRTSATAYWQMRICDLPGCLERTHLRGNEVRFNLNLTDPIEPLLAGKTSWRGIGGEYVVTLGPSSNAEAGLHEALPTLDASVGAFTRLWLGVRPASGLAVTDALSAPQELLEELDWALRLPEPKPDWDF